MKKYPYLALSILIILFSIIFIPKIINKIRLNDTVASSRSVKPGLRTLSYININGQNRKIPKFILLNQDSLFISETDYLGKVFLAEFFFSRCPTICPIMNKNMKEIYDFYKDEEKFAIASFTIDPEHDTPRVLKLFSENYIENSLKWNFLTGPKSQIFSLANNGFNIFAAANPNIIGGFEHQGYFALIDKNGYIRSRDDKFGNPIVYYLGIDDNNASIQGIEMLKEDISLLLKEK
ncbi:MAG: SCO family protein [Flavobacteriaceae bacterium]|nr:SCO family protein [Flavobacteriaceae bacterium]